MELKLIEVKPIVDKKIIHETLSRIGFCSERKKILWPSCYLYERDNRFFVVHFKELFMLLREDAYDDVFDEDIERRNSIIFMLDHWRLIEEVDKESIYPHNIRVFVLPYGEKKEWKIEHKIKNYSTAQEIK